MTQLPPKPAPRQDKVSLWQYVRLFRQDILSAQPARLYRAKMAEFRTPFFRSYLLNQPDLIRTVLNDRPEDFPKSGRVSEGLRPLLGDAVFVTNGEQWARQRRIIDPAFEGGRIKETWPAMWQAGQAMLNRLAPLDGTVVDAEEFCSHVAADVIFRTLFSVPIEDHTARQVYHAFRAYQRAAPIVNLAAFVPLPRWMPRFHGRAARHAARRIRGLILKMTEDRQAQIAAGTAPDDLATKIMTTPDPKTGRCFDTAEMADQVAIFFLAGHETSASAMGWALYLLATHPEWQDRLAQEAGCLRTGVFPERSGLKISRDVFRETLRLYPPVPMMVRQATHTERFRNRIINPGAQLVISPWHMHRHSLLWDNPDGFDPGRWHTAEGKCAARDAYLPFSSGPRVCPGAGFAMAEGPLLLSLLCRDWQLSPTARPEPVAHLTVRARDGIHLKVTRRAP